MIPNERAFNGRDTFEEDGKTFYRSYKIEAQGKLRLSVQVISIHSIYRQGIAFALSKSPKFKGTLLLNGQRFTPEQPQASYDLPNGEKLILPRQGTNYVIPVSIPNNTTFTMELDIVQGCIWIANASDYLDDYPELIKQISTKTGRTRDQFRGCSYTSGFTAGHLYGNAFWIEPLCEHRYRFHCNDHKMDDDFDDLIFDLEVEIFSEE